LGASYRYLRQATRFYTGRDRAGQRGNCRWLRRAGQRDDHFQDDNAPGGRAGAVSHHPDCRRGSRVSLPGWNFRTRAGTRCRAKNSTLCL